MKRYPSCLISNAHCGPVGTLSASVVQALNRVLERERPGNADAAAELEMLAKRLGRAE